VTELDYFIVTGANLVYSGITKKPRADILNKEIEKILNAKEVKYNVYTGKIIVDAALQFTTFVQGSIEENIDAGTKTVLQDVLKSAWKRQHSSKFIIIITNMHVAVFNHFSVSLARTWVHSYAITSWTKQAVNTNFQL
jgi:hypothetical protein